MTTQPILPTDVRVHSALLADASRIWKLKESGCAERDHFDISPQITFLDAEGGLIASVLCRGRNAALAAARFGAVPMRAAIVVGHFDAHVTSAMTNPATGRSWGPGEMQAACDTENACATGLLTDCIVSQAAFLDGHVEMLMRRYSGHEKAGGLHWGEPEHAVEDGKFQCKGLIADGLRVALVDGHGFNALAGLAAVGSSLTDEEAHWHQVCAAIKCMVGAGAIDAMILNPPTDRAQEIVSTSLTSEAIEEWLAGPMGPMLRSLGAKWGIGE